MTAKIRAFLLAFVMLGSVSFAKDQPPDDAMITDQVRIRLANDQEVKGAALQVDVKDGVVTLSGPVDEPKAKGRAEKLAKKVKGVKQVVNNLTVRQ